jgi:hypothetical protein
MGLTVNELHMGSREHPEEQLTNMNLSIYLPFDLFCNC